MHTCQGSNVVMTSGTDFAVRRSYHKSKPQVVRGKASLRVASGYSPLGMTLLIMYVGHMIA